MEEQKSENPKMLKKLDVLVILVKDITKTAEFYKTLGFTITEQTIDKIAAEVGNFYIDFHNENTVEVNVESGKSPKGIGIYIYVNVEDIDLYYETLVQKGLLPSSKPKDWSWGNREFAIKDPDGYKIVFYQVIK